MRSCVLNGFKYMIHVMRSVSNLVGSPEERFANDTAHIRPTIFLRFA